MDRMDDDMLVCRCEEITVGEVREAIAQGAYDLVGVKRRTRAGMGLCQGRTCGQLVKQLLSQELRLNMKDTGDTSVRPPVRPTTFGDLAKGVF